IGDLRADAESGSKGIAQTVTETKALQHHINGAWVAGSPDIASVNPSDTRDVVCRAPRGGRDVVETAVLAANAAQPAWACASPEQRSDILDKIGSTILSRREQLGTLLSREEGKTLAEGIGEVARAGRIFKYFAGEALRASGMSVDSTRPNVGVST